MKRLVSLQTKSFLIFLFFLTSNIFAQYSRVDDRVRAYSKTFSDSKQLAEKIRVDFSKPEERVRAAFTWIALNIKYDVGEFDPNDNIAYSYSSPEDQIRKEKKFR